MTINFYRWKDTDPQTKAKIMRRGQADIDAVSEQIKPIIEDVKREGLTEAV